MPSRKAVAFVICLLAVLHGLIGWLVLPALPVSSWLQWLGAAWLLLSFLLIPVGLLTSMMQRQPVSDRLVWAGMLAMGMFSSLLMMTLLR